MTYKSEFRFCDACGVHFNTAGFQCPRCDKPAPLLVPGPMFRAQLEPQPAPAWTIRPVFAWFDFWIGLYLDRANRRLYVFPVPMLGFSLQLPERVPGVIELRQRETALRLGGRFTREIRRARAIGKSTAIAAEALRRGRPSPPPAPPAKRRFMGFDVAEGYQDTTGFHFGPTPGRVDTFDPFLLCRVCRWEGVAADLHAYRCSPDNGGVVFENQCPSCGSFRDSQNRACVLNREQAEKADALERSAPDWTQTADLHAPEEKPGVVLGAILRFLDFLISCVRENPCVGCGRESSGTRPDGKAYCARCLADLEKLRERRRRERRGDL